MKKLLSLGLLIFLATACSSDDKQDPPKQSELKQYPVDFIVSAKQLSHETGITNAHSLWSISSRDIGEGEFGRGSTSSASSIYAYKTGVAKSDYTFFDGCCPVEWINKYDLDLAKVSPYTYPDIKNTVLKCSLCESTFNITTKNAISGKAKDLGYKLVEYSVEYLSETDEYHVSNPNYKE